MRALIVIAACAGCGRGFFDTPPVTADAAALDAASTPITFVQANSSTAGESSMVNCTFPAAQHAGDVNVLVVQLGGSLVSVSDSSHTSYTTAIGPQTTSSASSQFIYVGVASGSASNTVTVQVIDAADTLLAIVEYAGVDPTNPIDSAAGSTGMTGTDPTSGVVMTTNNHDLLIGAVTADDTVSGPLFFQTTELHERLSDPQFELGDLEVPLAGSFDISSGPIDSNWAFQAVALRGAN